MFQQKIGYQTQNLLCLGRNLIANVLFKPIFEEKDVTFLTISWHFFIESQIIREQMPHPLALNRTTSSNNVL